MSLLSKFKVSEIKIDSNFDEKDNHDEPFVFSAKFWADPSLVSIKSLSKKNWTLVKLYKLKKKNFRGKKRLVFPWVGDSKFPKLHNVICCTQLLIYAYKVKNWNKLAETLNAEFSVIATDPIGDEIKRIFWETLLARPMEFEVVQMIENVK